MPTVENNGGVEPEEEDMDHFENEERKSSEEESASGSGDGDEQEEDEDEGGSSGKFVLINITDFALAPSDFTSIDIF